MSRRISSYDELLAEQARLRARVAAQRELIRQDINAIGQSLEPVNSIVSSVGKLVTKDKTNWFLTSAADLFIDLVFKKTVLSRAGWIARWVIPFFMKNFSSHMIAGNKNKILNKIFSWMGKHQANGKMHESHMEEEEPLADEEED